MQNRLEEDLCWIIPSRPPDNPIGQGTELNWTVGKRGNLSSCRHSYSLHHSSHPLSPRRWAAGFCHTSIRVQYQWRPQNACATGGRQMWEDAVSNRYTPHVVADLQVVLQGIKLSLTFRPLTAVFNVYCHPLHSDSNARGSSCFVWIR